MTVRPIKHFLLALALLLLAAGPARAEMIDYPVAHLQSLDKISARTMTFEANVGSTVKFGPLYIKIQACRKAPPIEQPEAAAFLQIWEAPEKGDSKWVFSGWMFASSPSLSSMDHPVYDVWVLDCLEKKTANATADTAAEKDKEDGAASASESVVAEPSTDEDPPQDVPVE